MATRPDIIPGWRIHFNTLEVFKDRKDPLSPVYNMLIDCVKKDTPPNFPQLVDLCEANLTLSIKNKYIDFGSLDIKYREA